MKPLHPIQEKLLQVLRDVPEGGYSLGQLKDAVDAKHKSQIVHHIEQLEKKGLLKQDPDNSEKFIVFASDKPEEKFFFLPLLALGACGKGLDNEQNVIERMPVRSSMIPGKVKETFLVQADGDSMKPRINHGDILVVEEFRSGMPEPQNKIVVCEVNFETKIKRYSKSGDTVALESLNKEYAIEQFTPSKEKEFCIIGIVRGILFSQI